MHDARERALLAPIGAYYSARVRRHGAVAEGVDWLSPMGQRLRFVQLLKGIDWTASVTLYDVGCGYGAMLEHLADRHAKAQIAYIGSDLSPDMVQRARRRFRATAHARFVVGTTPTQPVDHAVASGIFNVKLHIPVDAWERHVADTLRAMCRHSRKGFAVNFMTPEALSQRGDAASQLYGVLPQTWAAHCQEVLGCRVQVVQGYGLQEFTLLCCR